MNSRFVNLAIFKRVAMAFVAVAMTALLAACGSDATFAAAPPAAAITAQPTDQNAVAGSTAAFNVTATNATGFQRQLSLDGGASFTNVPGAVSKSHTLNAATPADSGCSWSNITGATSAVFDVINAAQTNNGRQFRTVASNSAGTASSNALAVWRQTDGARFNVWASRYATATSRRGHRSLDSNLDHRRGF